MHRPADSLLRPPDSHDDNAIRQSPSIRLLESRFVYGEAHEGAGTGGAISDF